MNTFLKDVALQLANNHPNDLDKVLVVFNNRRPSLFLRREFKNLSDKAIFLPQMVGMDDLIGMMSHLSITPKEYLLFELYDIHRSISSNNQKFNTFESFISMADMMMTDFSEIDLYQVDAKELFVNLHDLKAIGEWNIEEPQLNAGQRDYLSFYKSLYTYYTQLRERLFAQGKAYGGMAYREVAEHIDTMADSLDYSKIYFVGFSVLSECEKSIINTLVRQGKAEMITDGDAYYCNNEYHEAGLFFNRLNQWLPKPVNHPEHFGKEPKEITLVNCPEDILQAKYAGRLLEQWIQNPSDTHALENTAIVLADENLLLPVLNALPQGVTSANVTMGFPYVLSGIHTFVLKLLSLHIKAKDGRFHHKDLLDILSDNYIVQLLGANNLFPQLQKHFAKEKVIYSNKEYIQEVLSALGQDITPMGYLFEQTELTPDQFLDLCQKLYNQIQESPFIANNVKEREACNCFIQIVEYFKELQESYKFIEELTTLEKIYARLAQRHTISFYGEPLEGLQILGMLETRNLNFDRIVILSTNEGILPSGRGNNTLIPYSLKSHFHIPTHVEKDAVFAYHFYRLIQRANDIQILYNTETTGLGKGEPSRFVFQIRSELAEAFPNIHVSEKVLSVANESPDIPLLDVIEKEQIAIDRLLEMGEYGFSPSALNRFRKCPRRFYYQDVLRVREQGDINEELDASELGSCIHEILKEIHNIGKGNELTVEMLQEKLDDIENIVDQMFKEQFLKSRDSEGKNRLLNSVAQEQISNFLQSEIDTLNKKHRIVIEEIESEYIIPLLIDVEGKKTKINIRGRIDRVDRLDKQLRVVDYKSGKTEGKELVTSKDATVEEMSDKWFQLMSYAWLYANGAQIDESIEAGIIPLKNNKTKYLSAQWGEKRHMDSHLLLDFQSVLQRLIGEILDKKKPFVSRSSKDCKYCAFKSICPQSKNV